LNTPIHITSVASISPLGDNSAEIWENYKNTNHFISQHDFNGAEAFAAFLPQKVRNAVEELRFSVPFYKKLDDSVLYAILASREAVQLAGWEKGEEIGINIGSSRGATGLFEKYHETYLKTGKAETITSPSTTLGNISSWVGQDIQSTGPEFSHSVTCSTGLHAILNAVAWLNSGMAKKFLAGGSEAALTPFTIAQMKSMKIYAGEELDFPCRALDMLKKKNSMVLGEGAGVVCLEKNPSHSLAQIIGIGYGTEKLEHSASISSEADCLRKSMTMAIGAIPPEEIDVVVMHAPGTLKGDLAEVNAIKNIFGKKLPSLTSNKWKIGHTFGASGILSLGMAILMLQNQEFLPVPFSQFQEPPKKLRNVLVNAVGFGGNAVSVLIKSN